ncbi:5-methyltetrahydropteroyltriglutamate--homocysteine methyltransferase-like isoform X2 [Lytechinus variegatus]|uniref:5-methyltetrahydropteroyltriglutamate-- homocysteine methyltransferase-like isoform X2 n=1 Tax=Lytechinus variegatus TaxID=7654 RepID=UPI001BB0EFEB|nr:5-methyltetrahydropteroyltriglutamate--homocysteine methyltransferase-like isoform X2 [Lytechinus variegatus]
MPLETTMIGSYPQPIHSKIPTWFTNKPDFKPSDFNKFMNCTSTEDYEALVDKAVKETLNEQTSLGIDVVTDGEIRRDNYINHLCRHVKGFDFTNLTKKSCRNGAWVAEVPTIREKLGVPEDISWIGNEWKSAQLNCEKPVKATVPGPMTIIGSTANAFYDDLKELSSDLVKVVNAHIKNLVQAGCRHIQLDEPVMVRTPDIALDYGIDHASQCFDGIGGDVVKTVHLCCGYPLYLDQTDYPKADKDAYFMIADKLDQAGFDEVSLEDAHRRNDLSLFDHFKKSKIVLGSVAIARSRVESVEEIRSRLRDVLKHLPSADHLIVAPDCGLGFLPKDILRAKLNNMVEAASTMP